MKKALVIGGGPAGCAAAHQLALLGGWDVLVVEQAPFIGGGCRTLTMGGHPYTFGPRHFITEKPYLFDFLNKFVPMRSCAEHEFKTYVEQDDAFYSFPIHEDDVSTMPDADKIAMERQQAPGPEGAQNLEEYWIRSVGKTLFDKFIDGYNKKMWMVDSVTEMDTFNWSPKGPGIVSGDHKVFQEKISAYPIKMNGYDDYFPIATADATVLLNTKIETYDIPNKTVVIDGEKRTFDIIISTIPSDVIFDFAHGELPFIGRDFYPFVLPVEHVFPDDVYFLYYAGKGAVTRVVEYKKLTKYKSPNSLLGLEVPSLKNRLYPIPIKSAMAHAQKYFDDMPEGVYSTGRAGVYRYGSIDFDKCIDHAMIVAHDLKGTGGGSGSALDIDSRPPVT
jgi:UDP-galactopyranose mutase